MSNYGIKRLLQMFESSPSFVEEFTTNPSEALKGFDLTKKEIEALTSRSDDMLGKIGLHSEQKTVDVLQKRPY